MTEMDDKQERFADKIAKLLRKAEGTDNPEEAETFTAKAQELMSEYAITEAMVQAKAEGTSEPIVEVEVECAGIHRHVLKELAFALLPANTRRGFFRTNNYSSPKSVTIVVIGYKSDVSRVEMLHTGLQLQLEVARAKWQSGYEGFPHLSMTTYTETWTTERGRYGEGTEYRVTAEVREADAEWDRPRQIVVTGTIYTIGAGGAVLSQRTYEDYQPQELGHDEEPDEETLRVAIRESLGIGWGDGPYRPEADQDRYDEHGTYTGRTLTLVTD